MSWQSWTSLGEKQQAGFPAHSGLELKRETFRMKILTQDVEHHRELSDVLNETLSKSGRALLVRTPSSGYGRVIPRSKAIKRTGIERASSTTQLGTPRQVKQSQDRSTVSPEPMARPSSAPAGTVGRQRFKPQPYNPNRRKMPLAGNWKR